MADPRPDTDEKDEPGGTPSHGRHDLIRKPVTPGSEDDGSSAAPGAYEADDEERERGKAVKPGN